MALPTYYDVGTVSVANGGTTVTGVNTLWGEDAIMAGDLFVDPAQPMVPPQRIADVTGAGTAFLAVPWPGTTMTAAPYEIRYVGIIERSTGQSRKVLQQLSAIEANGRGLFYSFDDATADADPGSGLLRLNNLTMASVTAAYLDNLDANGATVSAELDTWDDSSSSVKGNLWLRSIEDRSVFHAFSVTGSVVTGTGYRKLTLVYIGGSGSFANGDGLMVSFARSGDAGNYPGLVAYFASNTAPTGWLKANGAAVSRTTYAALFAKIGTTFGAGDGSTTFSLPDGRGEFFRGWDDGRGVDSGRAFGSSQADQNKLHGHDFRWTRTTTPNAVNSDYFTNTTANTQDITSTYDRTATAAVVPSGGSEARPRNIALLACIQY